MIIFTANKDIEQKIMSFMQKDTGVINIQWSPRYNKELIATLLLWKGLCDAISYVSGASVGTGGESMNQFIRVKC